MPSFVCQNAIELQYILEKFIKEVFGATITKQKMEIIFEEVDLDNNGIIDEKELLIFVKKL